jgi:hypothetical protein
MPTLQVAAFMAMGETGGKGGAKWLADARRAEVVKMTVFMLAKVGDRECSLKVVVIRMSCAYEVVRQMMRCSNKEEKQRRDVRILIRRR